MFVTYITYLLRCYQRPFFLQAAKAVHGSAWRSEKSLGPICMTNFVQYLFRACLTKNI
jgi:hypothetical protein